MAGKQPIYTCSMRSYRLVGDAGIVLVRDCAPERRTVRELYLNALEYAKT